MRAEVRLSVIVPTLGRPSLAATLESITCQLGERDEVIVVADPAGDTDTVRRCLDDTPLPCAAIGVEAESDLTGIGCAQRRVGMRLASGGHLVFIDDDDVYRPGAFDLFRAAACRWPVVFRMSHPTLGTLWREPVLAYGNVGTPMFLVPNDERIVDGWCAHVGGAGADFAFINHACGLLGEPVWREETVAIVRPNGVAGLA